MTKISTRPPLKPQWWASSTRQSTILTKIFDNIVIINENNDDSLTAFGDYYITILHYNTQQYSLTTFDNNLLTSFRPKILVSIMLVGTLHSSATSGGNKASIPCSCCNPQQQTTLPPEVALMTTREKRVEVEEENKRMNKLSLSDRRWIVWWWSNEVRLCVC